jgi:hypothetical protein
MEENTQIEEKAEEKIDNIGRAEKAAADLKEATMQFKAVLDDAKAQKEEQKVERILSGNSEAGTIKPKEEEISNQEYAKRALEGNI